MLSVFQWKQNRHVYHFFFHVLYGYAGIFPLLVCTSLVLSLLRNSVFLIFTNRAREAHRRHACAHNHPISPRLCHR